MEHALTEAWSAVCPELFEGASLAGQDEGSYALARRRLTRWQ